MQDERIKKVESLIQKEIGYMILHGRLKDPRITTLITVNRVKVSKDIAYAKVYVSSFKNEEYNRNATEALNKAAGYIQKMLGKKMKTRNTPKLVFHYDRSFEEGFRVNKLIEDALS